MSIESRLTDVVTVIGNDIKEVLDRLDGIVPETAAMLVNATHSGVSVAYNDASNTLTITNTDRGSTAVSDHRVARDPHPQYTTVAKAAAAAPVQSVNGQTGNVTVLTPSVQSAVLTETQAANKATLQTLTGHTFTIPPGKAAVITGNLIFTAAATSTGAFYGVLVTQDAGADGNAVGSWSAYINVNISAGVSDGGTFNIAGGASDAAGVLVTSSEAGNNTAALNCMVKNNSTNANTTVQIRFRSDTNNSNVTAQIGTMAVCVVS